MIVYFNTAGEYVIKTEDMSHDKYFFNKGMFKNWKPLPLVNESLKLWILWICSKGNDLREFLSIDI